MDSNEFKEKYGKYLTEAKRDEDEAAKVIMNTLGGKCYHTTPEIDVKCHTDLIWESPKGYLCAIDKKAPKKISRSDTNASKFAEWFEVQNVNGDPGSATPMVKNLAKYGIMVSSKHDYIMQEAVDSYLFLQRYKLMQLIKENTDLEHPVHKNPKKPYVAYQRENRKDIIVLVPIEDLDKIKHFGIYKNFLEDKKEKYN